MQQAIKVCLVACVEQECHNIPEIIQASHKFLFRENTVLERMGNYIAMSSVVPQDPERQALKKIGERAWTVMMGYVVNGSINSQKMRDFAYALGPQIGGNHVKRMEKNKVICDDGEFRRILADWWALSLHNLSTDEALEKLSSIFSSANISLHPLAKSIDKIRASLKEVGC